jgi:FkbM family methyltransferase
MMTSEVATNHAEGDVDKVIRRRFFRGQDAGVFVEVGAARPDYLSVSALYRELGWTVIAIEPNPVHCELHRSRGYEILEYACGDHDEDGVDFCVVDSHGTKYENGAVSYESFSSLAIKESYANLRSDLDVSKIKVNLRRLDTILETHAPGLGRIDILSVDVEGWELEVLAGLDFQKYRPRVMVIEICLTKNSTERIWAREGTACGDASRRTMFTPATTLVSSSNGDLGSTRWRCPFSGACDASHPPLSISCQEQTARSKAEVTRNS